MKFVTASLLLAGAAYVAAHGPKTADELKEYQALQSSIYHCAPAVAAYTAERKKAWQQRMLGADALADKNLFLQGAFEDLGLDGSNNNADKQGAPTLLSCDTVEETQIKNHTCVLAPTVTQGPYYHTWGHPIRQNMAEWQLGILFLMDVGVIDVETCEPLPNVLVDLWHANATGHYAGHGDPAPHLINEEPQRGGARAGLLSAFPRGNDWETFLRAAWPTDKNGVAQFSSMFPGYYTGRATHVHVKVHTEWTPLPHNNSFEIGNTAFTGQLFVDDDINIQVDKVWPYSTNPIANKWGRTRNWRDSLGIFDESHDNGHSPMFDIQKLNGVLEQGMIGYITLGVNKSAVVPLVPWKP